MSTLKFEAWKLAQWQAAKAQADVAYRLDLAAIQRLKASVVIRREVLQP